MSLQCAALVVVSVLLVVDQLSGPHADSRGYGVIAVAIFAALCAAALAVALWRRRTLAKTPTVLWNALAVLVGFSLAGGGAQRLGAVVLGVGIVGVLAGVVLPRSDLRR